MRSLSTFSFAALSAFLAVTHAQTWSDCDPMNVTDCKPNTALGVSNYTIDFTQSMMSDRVWNTTAGKISYDSSGADFIVSQRGDAPTVKTNFYIFFGQVEVIMKAAAGQGIVSSIVMQSDTLDEVDWEMIGGNDSYVQSNYFGKGNTTSYDRAVWHPVDQVQQQWHNYTVDWSSEKLDWYIDGQKIRTLNYADANGGNNFPQTPCDVRLGIWAGGDKANNNYTIEWAGGETDYNAGPFTMVVQSIRVSDASRGTQYEYGDQTGSWQSIKVLNTTTALQLDGDNSGTISQTTAQKWRSMSSTTKIAIGASIGGVVLACIGIFAFCCIKQRRVGKHEKLLEDAKFEKNSSEVLAHRAMMGRQRAEYVALTQQRSISPPHMGNAGATFSSANDMHGNNLSSYNYAPNNYAGSISTSGSARGYQRY